ncbi:MAG TPA: DNA repair protein RadC [Anaerolineae bacterium]
MSLLPDADTIDAILGTRGKGDALLGWWGSLTRLLQNLDQADLTDRQRARLRAAMRLHFICDDRASVRTPVDCYVLFQDMQAHAQEHFDVILLDTRNRVIRRENLYKGSLNTTLIRVGEVFRSAVALNAAAVIIAHNHPSGDPSPSPEDTALTREIIRAGKLLDIEVLDHIVVGLGRYVSLRESGLAFGD